MQFFEVNTQIFADGNRSRLQRWMEDAKFPRRDSAVFMICENARGLNENTKLIRHCLRSIANGGALAQDAIVIIDRSSEAGHFDAERAGIVTEFCSSTGLKLDRVIYVSQNELLKRDIPQIFASAGKMLSPQHLLFHHYAINLADKFKDTFIPDFCYDDLASLPPKFLCLNNKLRPHRYALASYIINSDLRDDFILSFSNRTQLFNPHTAFSSIKRDYPRYACLATEGVIPSTRLGKTYAGGGLIYSWPEKEVRDSFLTIVTESDYGSNIRRVTEKALKPLAYHRPFMVLGSKASLKILRRWGFETFADLWDESYDTVNAPEERLNLMLRTLRDLRDRMRGTGVRALVEACRTKCSHNQNHFLRGFERCLRQEFRQNFCDCLVALQR